MKPAPPGVRLLRGPAHPSTRPRAIPCRGPLSVSLSAACFKAPLFTVVTLRHPRRRHRRQRGDFQRHLRRPAEAPAVHRPGAAGQHLAHSRRAWHPAPEPAPPPTSSTASRAASSRTSASGHRLRVDHGTRRARAGPRPARDRRLPSAPRHRAIARTALHRADDSPGAPRHGDPHLRLLAAAVRRDPVVGQSLTVEGKPAEIIGVLPQTFSLPRRTAADRSAAAVRSGEDFIGNFSYQSGGPTEARHDARTGQCRRRPDAAAVPEKFPLPPGFTRKMFDGSSSARTCSRCRST